MKYKKLLVLSIFILLAITACGKKPKELVPVPTTESSVSMVDETVTSLENESSSEKETSVEVDTVSDDSTKRHEESEYDKWQEYISPKEKSKVDLDDESERLYDGFIYGHITAEFVAEGDRTKVFDLSDALEDGQSYTLDELIAKVNRNINGEFEWYYKDNIWERYIDLGLDETYEMYVEIGSADTHLSLVVKNNDGKLKICYSGDSSGKYYTSVLYPGTVSSRHASRAISHWFEEGYIDKDGNYNIWFIAEEDGESNSIYEGLSYEDSFLEDNPLEDGTIIFVDKISFNDDFSDEFYSISIWDKDDNYLDENNPKVKDVYSTIRNEFEQSGKKVVTRDEAVKMKEEQRKAIGYSDELYTYGDELRPQD